MHISTLAKQLQRTTRENLPVLLTAAGVVGVVGTAYLAGEARLKAHDLIYTAERFKETGVGLDRQEKFKLCWKVYIPTAVSGATTIACIVAANRVNLNRTAAVAAAYSLSERAFNDYRSKVVEHVGDKKEQTYYDEIVEERVKKTSAEKPEVWLTGNGQHLCFETFSGRYFHSEMESLRRAENSLNKDILHDGYASLADYYEYMDIPTTDLSYEVGWTSDALMEARYSTVLSDDNIPCIAVTFANQPKPRFNQYN